MKKLCTLSFFLIFFSFAKAQFAFIPDTNFRNFLMTNGFAGCMQGDSLDTTCTAAVNATRIVCSNDSIADLTGIEYFDSLNYLDCSLNLLSSLPALPAALDTLFCYSNSMATQPVLPPALLYLNCFGNPFAVISLPGSLLYLNCGSLNLFTLPPLPSNLRQLYCFSSPLTTLPTLPDSLRVLNCAQCQITSLPPLPPELDTLYCQVNDLTYLPTLPNTIRQFYCYSNQLTSLPNMPDSLREINCSYNNLSTLPPIACPALYAIECQGNQLASLPALQAPSLVLLMCMDNLLTSLPALPSALQDLRCSQNLLTALPALPASLTALFTDQNQLASLPPIPSGLLSLYCSDNPISSLPVLPPKLWNLFIMNLPLSCFPDEVDTVLNLYWSGTQISCLPRYAYFPSSHPLIDTLPLCEISSGCPSLWNITGNVFQDNNLNCAIDTNDSGLRYVPITLDSGGVELQRMYSNSAGNYSFRTGFGNYILAIDTSNLPFDVVCPPAFYQSVTLSAADSLDSLVNFGVQCRPGYDLIAEDISTHNFLSPGRFTTAHLTVGEGAAYYGASCINGVSGSVQVILDNLLFYDSPGIGSLTPSSVNGDTVTWIISDFGQIDPAHDFSIYVHVSPIATPFDSICIRTNVLPFADLDPSNNFLTRCFPIYGSYDPNEKYMEPSGQVDSSQQWFEFTIFFQNVGNAPAEDIYILDTLDQNLDATTFTFLSSSHDVITQLLPGKILRFNYPDINLADSIANEAASHGYVKFKMKRKENLPVNTTIANTAHIFFDFNAPVETNTVSATLSINVMTAQTEDPQFTLYPNPASDQLAIASKQYAIHLIEVYNPLGKKIETWKLDGNKKTMTVDLNELSSGIYFLKLQTLQGSAIKRFIKQ